MSTIIRLSGAVSALAITALAASFAWGQTGTAGSANNSITPGTVRRQSLPPDAIDPGRERTPGSIPEIRRVPADAGGPDGPVIETPSIPRGVVDPSISPTAPPARLAPTYWNDYWRWYDNDYTRYYGRFSRQSNYRPLVEDVERSRLRSRLTSPRSGPVVRETYRYSGDRRLDPRSLPDGEYDSDLVR